MNSASIQIEVDKSETESVVELLLDMKLEGVTGITLDSGIITITVSYEDGDPGPVEDVYDRIVETITLIDSQIYY